MWKLKLWALVSLRDLRIPVGLAVSIFDRSVFD